MRPINLSKILEKLGMDRKGVTPVVAVVLLIAITVTAAGTVYTMMYETQKNLNENEPEIPIGGDSVRFESCWGTPSDPKFSIRNTGSEAINASEIPVMVNSTVLEHPSQYTMSPSIADPQETFTMNIDISKDFNEETEVFLLLKSGQVSYKCLNLN